MAPKTPGLSILIPVYNEQATLDPLIERLGRALDLVAEPAEILFVNDGSTDETAERLRQARQHDAMSEARDRKWLGDPLEQAEDRSLEVRDGMHGAAYASGSARPMGPSGTTRRRSNRCRG